MIPRSLAACGMLVLGGCAAASFEMMGSSTPSADEQTLLARSASEGALLVAAGALYEVPDDCFASLGGAPSIEATRPPPPPNVVSATSAPSPSIDSSSTGAPAIDSSSSAPAIDATSSAPAIHSSTPPAPAAPAITSSSSASPAVSATPSSRAAALSCRPLRDGRRGFVVSGRLPGDARAFVEGRSVSPLPDGIFVAPPR